MPQNNIVGIDNARNRVKVQPKGPQTIAGATKTMTNDCYTYPSKGPSFVARFMRGASALRLARTDKVQVHVVEDAIRRALELEDAA